MTRDCPTKLAAGQTYCQANEAAGQDIVQLKK